MTAVGLCELPAVRVIHFGPVHEPGVSTLRPVAFERRHLHPRLRHPDDPRARHRERLPRPVVRVRLQAAIRLDDVQRSAAWITPAGQDVRGSVERGVPLVDGDVDLVSCTA